MEHIIEWLSQRLGIKCMVMVVQLERKLEFVLRSKQVIHLVRHNNQSIRLELECIIGIIMWVLTSSSIELQGLRFVLRCIVEFIHQK